MSIVGALWLLRSDYINATGEASRLVALSVLYVTDWTDTKRTEMAHPETFGLPPGELTGIQPRHVLTQENASNSCLLYRVCVFYLIHIQVKKSLNLFN